MTENHTCKRCARSFPTIRGIRAHTARCGARATPPARPRARSVRDEWLEAFEANHSNATAACKVVGISRVTAYRWRAEDDAFAERWDEIVEAVNDAAVEELRRRAVDGVVEPVYQGGVRVGDVVRYSDSLLARFLGARRPAEWGDRARLEHSGPDGAAIPLELVAKTAAEIEARLLAAPVVDAEAVEEVDDVDA